MLMTLLEAKRKVWPKILKRAKTQTIAYSTEKGSGGGCKYRVDGRAENRKACNVCFVGALITPANYSPEFEGGTVFSDFGETEKSAQIFEAVLKSQRISLNTKDRSKFQFWLRGIQNVHDLVSTKEWEPALKDYF